MRRYTAVALASAVIGMSTMLFAGQAPSAVAPLVPKAVTDVAAKYLTMRSGVSDTSVAPGGHVTLIVDITPKPSMHVYAPGQEGYLPIAIAITKAVAYTAAPIRFPPPRSMFLEPIQQTLKVYDRPFRVTDDVTIDASARGAVAIGATLSYQACDDNACYRTDTVPLTWTITAR